MTWWAEAGWYLVKTAYWMCQRVVEGRAATCRSTTDQTRGGTLTCQLHLEKDQVVITTWQPGS